jgi:hypothetical protein
MVVSRPPPSIAKDFVGANDLPELQRGIGIARMDTGVGPFDGFTECGPETFSVSEARRANRKASSSSLTLLDFLVLVRNSRREFTVEHSYKLNVTVLDNVDPVRRKNDLSDVTEPMLQATIVRGLWRKQDAVVTTHLCLRTCGRCRRGGFGTRARECLPIL